MGDSANATGASTTGTWYEYSKAAEVIGIDVSALKKLLKQDVRWLKKDRCQSQDAPYSKCNFVYVVADGLDAENTTIELSQWMSLCQLIDAHNDGNKLIFTDDQKDWSERYTGSRRIDVDAMKASSRFTTRKDLEKVVAAKKDGKKKKRNSKAEQVPQSSSTSSSPISSASAAAESSGSSSITTNEISTPPMGVSTAASVGVQTSDTESSTGLCTSNKCSGLNSSRVVAHPDLQYNLDRWNYIDGNWHCRSCLLNSNSGEAGASDPANWKRPNQCMKCFTARNNITEKRNPPLFDNNVSAEAANEDETKPSAIGETKDLMAEVVDSYRRLSSPSGVADLSDDEALKETMTVLNLRGIRSVDCGNGNKVFYCIGAEEMEGQCGTVEAIRIQSNNSDLCQHCQQLSKQANRRDQRREENWDRRTDPTSTVNLSHLTTEEIQARGRRANNNRKVETRKLVKERLQRAFDLEIRPDDGSSDNDGSGNGGAGSVPADDPDDQCHKFLHEIKEALQYSTAKERRPEFQKNVSKLLVELVKEGALGETRDPSFEFKESDAIELTDYIAEQLDNAVQKISGKSNQIRHGVLAYQLAYVDITTSKSSYREKKKLSPIAMPSEREMGRLKSISRTKDGDDKALYESRLRVKKDRSSDGQGFMEVGILMVDELKVKHGMVFNSSSMEPFGMADDDLDMKTVLREVLSGADMSAKPAQYVSQWRYKNLATNEAWNCSYYFNDGSLTGETLFRQFKSVLLSCEMIDSRVYGVCMDAGGNNARLLTILRGGKTLTEVKAYWIDDNLCYITNPVDDTRRIYIYFCLTHLTKAMRGQLHASRVDGAKSFQDENNVEFGWALITKLQKMVEESDADVDMLPRITEEVAAPTKYSKMSVTVAKRIGETRTLTFLECHFCSKLGIDATKIDDLVAAAKLPLPPKMGMDIRGGSKTICHGRMFYRAKVLMEYGLAGRGTNPLVTEELLSDLATYRYLTAFGALFNDLLINTDENFNLKNIGPYTTFIQDVMKYFDDWKEAQNRRKAKEDPNWETSFLDRITYNNFRSAICGFVGFCKYVLESVRNDTDRGDNLYIPMVFGNQTSLEGFFSVIRARRLDSANDVGTMVTTTTTTSAVASMKKSSYNSEDIGAEKTSTVPASGMAAYRSFHENRAKLVSSWQTKWKEDIGDDHSCSRFGDSVDVSSFKSPHSSRIFSKMNDDRLPGGYAALMLGNEAFTDWKRLSIGTSRDGFFNAFVTVPLPQLDALCQKLQFHLFGFIDKFISSSTDSTCSFEYQLYRHLVDSSFSVWYGQSLPENLRNSRFGAVILVRSLAVILEEWFFVALRKLYPSKSSDSTTGSDLTTQQVRQLIHRFIGAAMRASRQRIRGEHAKSKYGANAVTHGMTILNAMRLPSLNCALLDQDYMDNFYPGCIRHFNQGSLSLLRKELFPWAEGLVRKVWSSLPNSVISTHGRKSIKEAYNSVKDQKLIQDAFMDAFASLTLPSSQPMPDDAMRKLHEAMVKYVFLAYAGMRWDNKHGEVKRKSGSKHNVSHRTNIQYAGSGSGGNGNGSGGGSRRAKRKTPSPTVWKEFATKISTAINKLKSNQYSVATEGTNKLTKTEIGAVLWICYDHYISQSKGVAAFRNELTANLNRDSDRSNLAKADNYKLPEGLEHQQAPKKQRSDRYDANKHLNSLAASSVADVGSTGICNETNPCEMENDDDDGEDGEECGGDDNISMDEAEPEEEEGATYDHDDDYDDIDFEQALADMPMPEDHEMP